MNYWLIVNTGAGDGSRGESYWREHLQAAGIEGLKVRDLADTEWEGDVAIGDRVLVAGGDGSVNRVATVCVERQAVLGVLPSGTANDFARNLDLPDDPATLCRIATGEATLAVDVAWINDWLFLNVAHLGLGTLPAREASQEQKRHLGRFSYLLTLAQRIGMQKGIHARIECGEQSATGQWLTIAIASGAYFGGGHTIDEAYIDDGKLDVVAVRKRSWWRLLVAFVTTRLLRMTSDTDDTLVHFQAPSCRVTLKHPHTLTADGEDLGQTQQVEAFTRHGVLQVAGRPEASPRLRFSRLEPLAAQPRPAPL